MAVIACEDDAAVELVAYVAAAPGATLNEAALTNWMTARLSDAMRPRKLRFVPEIPMLGNFKHDIPRLRAMEREHALAASAKAATAPAAAADLSRAAGSAVREAVRAAWTRVLGAKSFDADLTWSQAGGDSLQALNFVFALEAALHRPMMENTLSPAMRPSDIIAKLQGSSTDQSAPDAHRPHLFLFPGVIRNVISIANFADELRAAGYDAHLLSYPPIDADHVRFVDFHSHLDYALAQMRAVMADDEPIRILGWSFGGLVAFEAACVLAREGRKVEFVGVVDIGPFVVSRDQSWFVSELPLQRFARSVSSGRIVRMLHPSNLSSRIIEEQLRRRMFGLLRLEWRLVDAIGWPRARRKFVVYVSRFIRMRSTRGLHMSHFPGPVHLFRCREQGDWDAFGHSENPEDNANIPADMNWGPYCTSVGVAEVPGNHNTPFNPENLPETLRVVLAALRGEAEDTTRPLASMQRIGRGTDPAPQQNEPGDADAALRGTVRAAWGALLGIESFDAEMSWDEAGGDSLKGLELTWGLENRLGHPVPVTVLDPRSRPSELIARIKAELGAPASQPAGLATTRHRPRVFVLPGALGPDFNIKRFVDALAGSYDMELLDYPAVDPAAIQLMSFESVSMDAVRQIRAKVAKDEPIHIIGYSLGAFVAQFAARALAEAGYRIGFVGLIDAGPVALGHLPYFLTNENILRRLMRTVRKGELFKRNLVRPFALLLERQLREHRFKLLSWEWRLINMLGIRRATLYFRLAAMRYVRARSAHSHVPPFYSGPVHVFRGTDPKWEQLQADDDLNWRRYCAEVTVWKVTGPHTLILEDPNFESIRAAVVTALDRTTGKAKSEMGRLLAS